jgi:hypothetical protein
LVHPDKREVIPLAPEPIVKVAGTLHVFHAYADVLLNNANYNERVNVLECWETKKDGRKQRLSWVTKLSLKPENIDEIMRAERSRWRIKNETFNTLKSGLSF